MEPKDRILVVGGYGHVGRVISTMLGEYFPGHVFVAGRNFNKAEKLSLETKRKVLPLQLDLSQTQDIESKLTSVRVAVVCLDQADTNFVQACLARGIHYIDISASFSFLSRVEQLDSLAKQQGATAVLSVGLAPGLTNLLARHCKTLFDELWNIDIYILLGLGEAHGKAAIQWTIDNMDSQFLIRSAKGQIVARSFSDPKQTTFPGRLGKRTAYRFNFADQHVIARTLGVESVATRLCFDSAAMTDILALLTKVRLFGALKKAGGQRILTALFSRLRLGSDRFVVQVDAKGYVDQDVRSYSSSIQGHQEGYATGVVAAMVAEHLYTSRIQSGVHHIDQLFEPAMMFAQIANSGFEVELARI